MTHGQEHYTNIWLLRGLRTWCVGWLLVLLALAANLSMTHTTVFSQRGTSTISSRIMTRRRHRTPAQASASYSRYSTDLQDETSLESQQERCREAAHRDGQAITPAFEFADAAVSGTKLDRDGLNALLHAAEEGRINRVYFFSLSRLARESVIGLPILKRLVNVLKVRVISVTEGLDTDREGWEMLAQILLMQHERYVKELAANTFRGQTSNIRNNFSNGDYCFGYTSVSVPGTEQQRRGRHSKPRMKYAIDPVTSAWVKQIFDWFVRERRTIRWITRELNRLGAPKDHRSKHSKLWHHNYVTRLLGNRKYVGDWLWGEMKNVRDPETGDIGQEPRSAEEAEQYRRLFPELRLIDEETFAAAQQYLLENREKLANGRNEEGEFTAGRDGTAPPPNHLLAGLVFCGECGHRFYVGGSRAQYLHCPGYDLGVCNCKTMLNRKLAAQLILEQISRRLLNSEAWLREVFNKTHAAWLRRRETLPDEMREAAAALTEVNRRINRLLDSIEGQESPDEDVARRLAERRAERRRAEDRLLAAQATANEQPVEPTESWIRERLRSLYDVLHDATPAAAHALSALVGGRIIVRDVREDGAKRSFLRGSFQLTSGRAGTALGIRTDEPDADNGSAEEVSIDFRQPDTRDELVEIAWRLHKADKMHLEIAAELKRSKNFVTRLLKLAAAKHGEPYIDGRSRRSTLVRKHQVPPPFERIAEEVGRLVAEGVLLIEIAERLQVDKATVTKAHNKFRADRGLPPLDGRKRRGQFGLPNRRKNDDAA